VAGNVIVLYRIVQDNPPRRVDMLSYQALGIVPDTDDPELLRISTGISLYNTLQQARNQMRRLPAARRGFIAELHLPANSPVTIERTGSQRGHHTLWGNADDILNYVVRVIPPDDSVTGDKE
jgi:hypothetical protein